MIETKSDVEVDNAEVGQLWELSEAWHNLIGESPESYLLLRRVAKTHVWDALRVETGEMVSLTLSSLLYERVV